MTKWHFSIYWRPSFRGFTWFNVDAPYVSIATPWGAFGFWLWECFNRVGAEQHIWGVSLLKVNKWALFAWTSWGISGLFQKQPGI
jgi:hypothetical protein